MQGKIIKGVGGFYYVHLHQVINEDKLYECKAKGIFRNKSIKPTVGDNVEIDIIDEDAATGNIVKICDRKNELIRPTVANVDQAIIIFAIAEPEPNYNLLDRFLIMMEKQSVPTIICLNKADLRDEDKASTIKEVYEKCGYKVIITSTYEDKGIEELKEIIANKTTVFAGPSGVGKSSLLNSLKPEVNVATGAISEKIKRGKHTTRHSELMFIGDDTFIMDTPGFSSLFVDEEDPSNIKTYYGEFDAYISSCRFNGCVHINEPDCGVKDALSKGLISELRYENYKQLYDEQKSRRRW